MDGSICQPAQAAVKGSRFIRGLCRAQWIVIPALVFVSLECAVRRAERRQALPIGWNWPELGANDGTPLDYIFLGSSRVGSSINTETFELQLSQHSNRPVRAVNLGHGWSYLLQNCLWLRNLWREHPEQMKGAVVVAEAPGGLLAFECQSWHERWYEPGLEHQLVHVLRADDLPHLWASPMSLEDKLRLSFGFLTRKSELIARRAAIGQVLITRGREKAAAWAAPFIAREIGAVVPKQVDLSANVGIRTEDEAIARNRKLAIELAKAATCPEPLQAPGQSVVEDIARITQAAGGKLVFFEMPQHSVQAAAHQTKTWKARRAAFAQLAREWSSPILATDFHPADDDFPDIWHLRQSLAVEFTAALARSYIRAETGEDAGAPTSANTQTATPFH